MIRSAVSTSVILAAGLLLGLPVRAQEQPVRAVSFSKDVLPILKTSCGKCHTGGGAKAKLDLSTYAGLKKGGSGGPAFVEGDPGKSALVTSISGDKPEMPKKAGPLTKAQVTMISTWVKEGAKNN
ncbi:MAG TPA: c-type cytochrome domain-containing protein [Planctomycetota bacterium]|jgi:mono/diheme cytochrome c family protein|nr:c-type cytochrome domain-containing protein [Planctomycetota bacterium]